MEWSNQRVTGQTYRTFTDRTQTKRKRKHIHCGIYKYAYIYTQRFSTAEQREFVYFQNFTYMTVDSLVVGSVYWWWWWIRLDSPGITHFSIF